MTIFLYRCLFSPSEIFSLWHADTFGKCKPDLTSIDNKNPNAFIKSNFTLEQNYPNPFNPTTSISYTLPVESRVRISVFNILGEILITLVNGIKPSGSYKVNWDASNISSGLYLYKIEAIPLNGEKSFTQVKKMILLK